MPLNAEGASAGGTAKRFREKGYSHFSYDAKSAQVFKWNLNLREMHHN